MRLWGWRLALCSCCGHRGTSRAVSGGGGSKGGDHPPGIGPGWGVGGMGKQPLLTSLFSPKTSQERVPPS